MGSFVFKWNQPATVVYVTGTFDDWKKSEQLEKVGDSFEKKVFLPDASSQIFYKVRSYLYIWFLCRRCPISCPRCCMRPSPSIPMCLLCTSIQVGTS
ncbi:hypothetical protein GGS24DRAFT_479784 [Hypoxylon argillaceum]|nr:hypothetical protein GGS24DRAFT_479784 [Hypoxylon argillaceum]